MTDWPGAAWLFCPADKPERFAKASAVADVVILDLEDGVSGLAKDAARRNVQKWLRSPKSERIAVRTNAVTHPEFELDLEAIADFPEVTIILPMTTSPHDLQRTDPHPTIALCETARGILAAESIAHAENCVALMMGAADLAADLGLRGTSKAPGMARILDHARCELVLAAAVAGRRSIDTASLELDASQDTLRREAALAAEIGMHGKACIHPSQVPIVRHAFAPSEEDMRWASAVMVHVAEAGDGATRLGGQMIDAPVIRQAKAILGRHDVVR